MTKAMIIPENVLLNRLKAGDSIVTLRNQATGGRVTYRVTAAGESLWEVRVFTGTDNSVKSHYTLIGEVQGSEYLARGEKQELRDLALALKKTSKPTTWLSTHPEFMKRLWGGGSLSNAQEYRKQQALRDHGVDQGWRKVQGDKARLDGLPWLMARLQSGKGLPETVEVWHEGRCCRCARRLTVPESIILGLGPACATRA